MRTLKIIHLARAVGRTLLPSGMMAAEQEVVVLTRDENNKATVNLHGLRLHTVAAYWLMKLAFFVCRRNSAVVGS